jgi:hypothetical protein
MKNRRITIVAFLLIAALTLGFGYAAVTNVLDIQGSASVSATAAEEEFNEDVYFAGVVVDGTLKDAVATGDALGYTANINTNNNDKAQFTVTGLKQTGDKATITFRVQNDSLYDATVTVKTDTNTNKTNFSFTNDIGEGKTVAAGGYVDVTVEVEFIKAATEAVSASFVVELSVTAG